MTEYIIRVETPEGVLNNNPMEMSVAKVSHEVWKWLQRDDVTKIVVIKGGKFGFTYNKKEPV